MSKSEKGNIKHLSFDRTNWCFADKCSAARNNNFMDIFAQRIYKRSSLLLPIVAINGKAQHSTACIPGTTAVITNLLPQIINYTTCSNATENTYWRVMVAGQNLTILLIFYFIQTFLDSWPHRTLKHVWWLSMRVPTQWCAKIQLISSEFPFQPDNARTGILESSLA